MTANFTPAKISELLDVDTATVAVNEYLVWNGTKWMHQPLSGNATGAGTTFYPQGSVITATSVENAVEIDDLAKMPDTGVEHADTVVVNANTVAIGAYLYNVALGRTSIDAGIWNFHTYAGVDSGAGVSTIVRSIFRVRPHAETVTVTGTGTSRTATASGGTPFATSEITASADVTIASYIQTPKGLYQITARTSDTVVTIAMPTGYVNEAAVAMSVWKELFSAETAEINNISPAYGEFQSVIVQPAFTLQSTDKLAVIFFGRTTSGSNKTISYVHSGTVNYSHFDSPLLTMHNELAGLNLANYMHITAAEYADYNPKTKTINAQVGTTYQLALTDSGKVLTCTNASPVTLTVPNFATIALAVGSYIEVIQGGAGKVTLAAGGGVTLNAEGGLLSIAVQWGNVRLVKTATDVWSVMGRTIA